MTKDEMVALAKQRNVPLGDYARKTKEEIAAMLAGETLPTVNTLNVIAARFPGKCSVCGQRYGKGTEITRSGTGKWAHSECAGQAQPEAKVQPSDGPSTSPQPDDTDSAAQADSEARDDRREEEQQADADSQKTESMEDVAEPSLDDQLEQAAQQQQQADPDAFVAAVRSAVASDGRPGMALVQGIAASAAMQVAQQMAAQAKPAPAVDLKAVQKIVDAAIDNAVASLPAAPREIIVKVNDAPTVKLDAHTHPLFEKALRLTAAGLNVMLVGPAGCGKSTLAEQVAKALGADFGMLNCTAGASEAHLTGWLLPVGEAGRFEYVESQFIRMTEAGGALFLLDEYDALDPNMSLVLQALLSAGKMALPHRVAKPMVAKHATMRYMAAANTYGTGADIQYAGRNLQDAAALDRWYVVEMGYDEALEAAIAGRPAPAVVRWVPRDYTPTELAANIGEFAAWHETLRAKAKGMRRVVGTRMLQKGITALRAGCRIAEIKADALAGWTKDERSRAGVA